MKFASIIDDKWQKSEAAFNEKYFKESVALAILFRHTEWIVSHQPWFEKGYRANIVTYSLALLHRLIRTQFKDMDLDLQIIWNKQQVPDVISNELVKITKYVFDSITDPKRATINVTQWCKRDACWETVRKCGIRLSPNVQKYLVSKEDNKSAEKEAKSDQKMISDMQAQSEAIKLGADYWKQVDAFVKSKKVSASPDQLKALSYAIKIPKQIPSAYQSLQLMKLLEESKANGFKS